MAKLAQYEERKGDNSVEEDIDGRILELLGLEDVVDFTYSEYKTLLREKMVAGRMPGQSGMSNEDVETLTDEFKRVKSKTGIFVIRANKPTDMGGVQTSSRSKPYNETKALLAPAKEEDEVSNYALTTLPSALNNISKVLQDMNNILEVQVGVDEDELEAKKDQDLQDQRAKEEKDAEKKKRTGFRPTMPSIPKVEVPFIDKIFNYFKNIVIGGFAIKALKWLNDPKNQESIDKFVDFIVDSAPLVLGGLLALVLLPVASTIISVTGAILSAVKGIAIAIGGLLSLPGVVPLLAAAGLVLADQQAAGGFDQVEGDNAMYMNPKLSPEQKISIIDSQIKDNPYYQDLNNWPKSMVDTYAEAHKELGRELPAWFIEQRSSGSLGRVDIEEEKAGPSLEQSEGFKSEELKRMEGELQTLRSRLSTQQSYGTDPRAIYQTKAKIESVEKRIVDLGGEVSSMGSPTSEKQQTGPTAEEVRPDGMMSDFDYYSSDYNLNRFEQGGGRDNSYSIGGVGTVTRSSGFLGLGEEKYTYFDQDTGKEMTAEEFRSKLDSLMPEDYDPKNIRSRDEKKSESVKPPKAEVEPKEEKKEPTPTTSKEPQEEMSSAERTEAKVEKPPMQKPQATAPKPPGTSTITAIPVVPKSGGKGSGTTGNGLELPSIPASDPNNDNLLITRTIYNIIQ